MKIMMTLVVKRSVKFNGRKTSVSLEDEFWDSLHEIADSENVTISELLSNIARTSNSNNLSSSIRTFVFDHFRAQAGCSRARLSHLEVAVPT